MADAVGREVTFGELPPLGSLPERGTGHVPTGHRAGARRRSHRPAYTSGTAHEASQRPSASVRSHACPPVRASRTQALSSLSTQVVSINTPSNAATRPASPDAAQPAGWRAIAAHHVDAPIIDRTPVA